MIGKQYKVHKDNVIDLFNRYREKRGEVNDGVDVEVLENRIKSLKNGKFTLAVAGEVKAGKSTFINALLEAEILPSDVLQASSAIVEIFKSEKSFLKVKFADGHEKSLYDDLSIPDVDKANERLHEICKIHDEFRHIPTTLIDDYIIKSDGNLAVNGGEQQSGKPNTHKFDWVGFIKQLEQQSGEPLQEKQRVIERYISERTKDKIPVEIEFGYPLKWEFDELRIVDTPGVNATGGVQDVSFRFFKEANAILFVHPIKPIESKSFRDFVRSVIIDRSQETLFLVLTHAGLYSNDEVERLHGEAGRLYKNIIPENRILVVDSLLKLIHSDLDNGVLVEDIKKSENKKKILSSYREQAKDEARDLIDVVRESSRFERLFDAINEFSMKAPNLQLQEILENIKKGYEDQEIQYVEKANLLEKKKRNPQEFEEDISRICKELEEYKLLTKQTKEDLTANYSGKHSSWQKDIESLKVKYSKLITGSDSIERTRKNTVDGLCAVQDKGNEFSTELTQKLSDTLEKRGKEFSPKHQISIPKVDLKALEEKTKKSAYYKEDVYEDRKVDVWDIVTLGIARLFRHNSVKTGTKQVLDKKKFLSEWKKKCEAEFSNIVNKLPNKSKEVLNNYLEHFEKKMDSVIDERQRNLENMKNEKQSNAEIIAEIESLNEKKKAIQPEKSRCIEVLEDLL